MTLQHFFCAIDAQNHKRSCISIGCCTVFCQNSSRQQRMLNWIARLRIDCMGVFLTVLIIKITIISTRGHRQVCNIKYTLNLTLHGQSVISRLCHANLPRQTLGINTACDNFATYLHHEILHALLLQETGYHIRAKALGNGRTVEHNVRRLFHNTIVFQGNFLIANQSTKTVHLTTIRLDAILKTESPCID